MVRIRIGMPVYRTVLPQTVASLWALKGFGFTLDMEIGADCALGRNKIIRRMLKENTENFLLLVDADMAFEPEHVRALLDALHEDPQRGAVAAHYIRWDGSAQPVCNWRENGHWINNRERAIKTVELQRAGTVEPVDMCGGGLWLIRKTVFESMPDPWFHTQVMPDQEDDDKNTIYGNDTVFVQKMKEHNWNPCVHFGVCLPHIGPTPWFVDALESVVCEKLEWVPKEVHIGDGDAN